LTFDFRRVGDEKVPFAGTSNMVVTPANAALRDNAAPNEYDFAPGVERTARFTMPDLRSISRGHGSTERVPPYPHGG
jgi:hypothetical protein